MDYSRRDFLKASLACASSLLLAPGAALSQDKSDPSSSPSVALSKHPAQFYKKLDGSRIQCQLCPRECIVPEGERGYCRVRENQKGEYFSIVYGRPCTYHVDPIEKKPFYHFMPGTTAFSLAAAGCNMHCKFCQNWQISQPKPEELRTFDLPPSDCVSMARKSRCSSIAITYTEPLVSYEYTSDIAKASSASGLATVVISAGYINTKPLEGLLKHLAAIKIDLKAFDDSYYRKICETTLEPVLDTLKTIKASGVWLEIVNLILPTLNDSVEEHKRMFDWILKNLGESVPLHLTRFHPTYRMRNLPPTPQSTLQKLYELAKEMGLNYPYIGNVPGDPASNTYCPKCKKALIIRRGFAINNIGIVHSKCRYCGELIPGIWPDSSESREQTQVG
ncbi:MAG: AmmeMemoRadiSam system radical SAM enzyme [Candidatus Coatesbacteria bacterium]|nr:AmmeMemoRadiSam system radical SAM enzyme [Candidatus Coatesbacteria bacterium]